MAEKEEKGNKEQSKYLKSPNYVKWYVTGIYTPIKRKDRQCQNKGKIYNYMFPIDAF